MSSSLRWVGWLGGLAALAGPLVGQDSATARPKIAHITYLVGATAYLDAGRLDGLREGARADVVRGTASVAVLQVAFLASHKAACTVVTSTVPLAVGDSVRFVPAATPRDSGTVAEAPRAPSRTGPSQPGLRGRVGVEYFLMRQNNGASGSVSQPGFTLRLDGAPGGGPAINLAIDVRGRRTYTILPDGTAVADDRNRVYQAALAWHTPGSPLRITAGRQLSGELASIGLFDGVLGEVHQPDWTTGVFLGTEPEPLQLGFSSAIFELGGYAQRHSRPGAASQWAVSVGAASSEEAGHANRDFGFVQGRYLDRTVTAFVTQEVDYYPAWKLLPGMHTISPTSTFALVQVRVRSDVTLDGGFDNRRNVRLYQDAVNPETAFDNTYRQGAWAGVWVQVNRRVRVGLDALSSSGGVAGHADAYTASVGVDRLTRLGLSLRTRTTYYSNPQLTGWLQSGRVGFDPSTRLHLELNGGLRVERNPLQTPPQTTVLWWGTDVDLTLARAWYGFASATEQHGGIDGYDQLFVGLSYRF